MPPEEGWIYDFVCTYPKENKRKIDDHSEETNTITKRRMESLCLDLIVLGLPWKTTDQELRAHFEEFGQLVMAQVKKDIQTGKSKGFGFIRFASMEGQRLCLAQRHTIEGRRCEVRIPNSKGNQQAVSNRVFIGRVTESITEENLREHF